MLEQSIHLIGLLIYLASLKLLILCPRVDFGLEEGVVMLDKVEMPGHTISLYFDFLNFMGPVHDLVTQLAED